MTSQPSIATLEQPRDPSRASWLLLATLATIYLIEWWVSLTATGMPEVDLVAWGQSADLVLGVPLLVYLVGVRRLGWAWTTVVPATVVGLITAHRLAPAAKDGLLADIELLLMPAELALLGFIGWRAYRGMRRLRQEAPVAAGSGAPVWSALRRSAEEVVGRGRASKILGYELAMLVFALGFWRRPVPEPTPRQFTVDRRSGFGLLMGGLAIATAAEIVPIHVLLDHFVSPVAAWILTALSLYGGFFVLGHWQAVRRQPLELRDDALHFRLGLLWEVTVPYAQIGTLRPVPVTEVEVKKALSLVPAGRPSHCLELRQPVTALGPYGLRQTTSRITLHVDEPQRFEQALGRHLAAGMGTPTTDTESQST